MNFSKLDKVNILFLLFIAILFFVAQYNFLLFHSLIEILSIVIAGLIFMVTLSARKIIDNSFIIIIGVSYFFIGLFDLLHAFSYSGLSVFPGADANLPTQLWLVARLTEGLSILTGLFLLKSKLTFRGVFLFYSFFGFFVLASIFYWPIFPTAYVAGEGITNFKLYSEYFIISILFISLFRLYKKRNKFNAEVFRYLNYSIAFTILAEVVFTMYFTVYDIWTMLGHLLKLISFYFIYCSIAEIGIQDPQEILFNNLKKSEKKLARSEKKYKELFGNMNSGFALHKIIDDKDGRAKDYEYVEVNDAFLEIVGLVGQNIVGKRVTELIPNIKDDPADWVGKYSRVAKENITLKFEQFSEPLGKWFLVKAYCPQPGFFATLVDDITDRKETEKELQNYTDRLENLTNELFKFQLAVEDASEAIVITDVEGKIIYINKATEEITAFSEKEIVGNTSRLWGNKILSKENGSKCENKCVWDCLRQIGDKFSGEVLNKNKSGKEFYSLLTISPVRGEKREILFYICIEKDITKLKEVEKEKTDFVYFVSHELKTPLASIFLSIDLFIKESENKITKSQLEYLSSIREASHGMSDFIEALLNVSRIESNTLFLDSEPMDVGIEIRNLVDDLKMEIENKKLSVKFDFLSPQPIVMVDEKIFNLIIRNLITNAIHYTDEKGTIKISTLKKGKYLEICVADTGCGISEEDQEKIFDKLFRTKTAVESKTMGSGLGLYIVKNMTEKIGAKIRLESEEGKGSKFYISFLLMK